MGGRVVPSPSPPRLMGSVPPLSSLVTLTLRALLIPSQVGCVSIPLRFRGVRPHVCPLGHGLGHGLR